MRSLKLLLSVVAFSFMSFAAISATPSSGYSVNPASGTDITPSLTKKQQQIEMMKWFVSLSPKEYGKIRGKKLNIFEKAAFRLTQYRMKQQLKASSSGNGESVNWGGLALGFFLGLLGVLGAYIFSTNQNFRKWTWIGFGVWVVLLLIVFVF